MVKFYNVSFPTRLALRFWSVVVLSVRGCCSAEGCAMRVQQCPPRKGSAEEGGGGGERKFKILAKKGGLVLFEFVQGGS